MLTITIPGQEFYDEIAEEFIVTEDVELTIEHSLVSLSKWEQKHEVPFLASTEKTEEQVVDYIKCMTISTGVPSEAYDRLSQDNLEKINTYINAKMTATWFAEDTKKASTKEIITSEVVYYWMVSLNIPIEFENWHLNRLFTLVRVINDKNAPPKKMSKVALAARNRELNAQRKAQMKTSG